MELVARCPKKFTRSRRRSTKSTVCSERSYPTSTMIKPERLTLIVSEVVAHGSKLQFRRLHNLGAATARRSSSKSSSTWLAPYSTAARWRTRQSARLPRVARRTLGRERAFRVSCDTLALTAPSYNGPGVTLRPQRRQFAYRPTKPAGGLGPVRSCGGYRGLGPDWPTLVSSSRTGQGCGLGSRSSRRAGVAPCGRRESAPAGPPPEPAGQAPCSARDSKATHPCSSPASSRFGTGQLLNR